MTWYAIRTAPGAQKPQREYHVEPTRSPKGYRIVPSLDPNVSAIERVLKDAKIEHYMPVERRVIRDRRKPFRFTTRRFAMLVGYVFVRDIHDWPSLEALPGVVGIVGNQGEPLPIPERDIAVLREAEAIAEMLCQAELRAAREAMQKVTRRKAGQRYPKGSTVLIAKGIAQGKTARVLGTDRGGRIKAIIEGLNAIGTISVPAKDVVRLVA